MSRRSRVAAVLALPARAVVAVGRRTGVNESIGRAVDSGVDRALESEAVERTAARVIDSDLVDRLWQRILAGEEAQQLVERIAEAPEVRAAIARQGVGLIDDLRRELGKAARKGDAIVEHPFQRLARHPARSGPVPFAGVVTRGLALAIDIAIINLVILGGSALIGAVISAFGGNPEPASAVIAGAAAWLIVAAFYASIFWSFAGQTPGMRFMAVEVRGLDGKRLHFRRALRRYLGLLLAALPFGAGLVIALFSERRRGLQDLIAHSVVVYVDAGASAAPWSQAQDAPARKPPGISSGG